MPDNQAEFECIVCGGPEPSATSMHGCRTCGAQDEIVPRGTRQKVLDRPDDVKTEVLNDIVTHSIDGVIFARERVIRH